jgi:uncharacterized membrane protein YeiH
LTVEIAFFNISLSAFTVVDLVAATTNAFNGALLARRPDHYRNYTIVGIVILAVIGGIAGGVVRDVLLNDIPAAFTDPLYLIFCVAAALLAVSISFRTGQMFREGLFSIMTAFSLPWYAAAGVYKGLTTPDVAVLAAIVIGVIGPTAGRWFIDVASRVPPKQLVRGEWFVGTAILTSVVFFIVYWAGLPFIPATLVSFAVGFTFRLLALWYGWEEPEPWDQPGTKPEAKRKTLKENITEEFRKHKNGRHDPG